jgi:glycerate kinase
VIEMSEASGLTLLDPTERNPMLATTFGTGELIRDALNKGCSEVIIGIGGSATIDGGVGMAMALGWRFLDQSGKDIGYGGHSLGKLVSINRTQVDRRLEAVKITAACDVTNVLTGAEGAAHIYGLQKGATEAMIAELDSNLARLAEVVRHQLHTEIQDIEGSGAAGGMGGGIVAFLGGKLSRGFDLVSAALNLEQFMNWADVVITAEGKIDAQTAFGKTTGGVAQMAAGMKKPVIAFCGALDADIHSPASLGFQAIIPIADRPMTLTESISEAGRLLEAAGERVGKLLALQIINQFPA